MQLTSSDFRAGEAIPTRCTCEGDNVSPQLSWQEPPRGTKSFALIVHDPDAPRPGGFMHWVLYDIPASKTGLDPEIPTNEQISGTGVQGKNDGGKIGYMGPCPPSGTHRYYIRLFAVDQKLGLPPGANHKEVMQAMEGHILEKAELMGTYAKQSGKAA